MFAQDHNFRAARIALVERIMLARVIGDFDYLETISTPDIVVKLIGDKKFFPYCGARHGRKDARAVLEQVHVDFSFHNMKMVHIIVDGDHVCLRWTGTLRNRGTGASGHFEGFSHLVFRDDLVCEYVTLLDTAFLNQLSRGE